MLTKDIYDLVQSLNVVYRPIPRNVLRSLKHETIIRARLHLTEFLVLCATQVTGDVFVKNIKISRNHIKH